MEIKKWNRVKNAKKAQKKRYKNQENTNNQLDMQNL